MSLEGVSVDPSLLSKLGEEFKPFVHSVTFRDNYIKKSSKEPNIDEHIFSKHQYCHF